MTRTERGPGWELRLGRWQDVLADVERVDSVITDPPYSERTHAGQRSISNRKFGAGGDVSKIEYDSLDSFELPPAAAWSVIFSDHTGFNRWESELLARGLYVFAPLVWVKTNAVPRLAGDGPCCALEWICAARRRTSDIKPGSLPGYYQGLTAGVSDGSDVPLMGRKPLWLMRAIVRDYSRPGDLICDPYAGSGTTLLAAVMEGRRAIGAEMDEGRFELAVKRLRAGIQQPLL